MKRVILIILFALLLTSCLQTESRPSKLRWNLGPEPKTIHPTFSSSLYSGSVIHHIYEGLVREQDGKIIPGLAKSWKLSEDQQTITFYLRESYWSDGSPLTAKDFLRSWKAAINPATGSPYSWIWNYTNIKGVDDVLNGKENLDQLGIHAPHESRLVVELTQPTPYFLSLMSFYHFMPVKDLDESPHDLVTNGPYLIDSYRMNEGIDLKKNPNYWKQDQISIPSMDLVFISDTLTSYQAYENRDILATSRIPSDQFSRLIKEDSNFHLFPLLGTEYYAFNLAKAEFQDPRVRQAIQLAIDKDAIVTALGNIYQATDRFVGPGFNLPNGDDFYAWSQSKSNFLASYNPGKAQQLLAEAGYPKGENFPPFKLLYSSSERTQKAAEIIQEMLKQNLGISLILDPYDWSTFLELKSKGSFDMARSSWFSDFADPISMLSYFRADNIKNSLHYESEDYNRILDQASHLSGQPYYDALYEAEEILLKDYVTLPLFSYRDYWLIDPSISGWHFTSYGTMDFSHCHWVED